MVVNETKRLLSGRSQKSVTGQRQRTLLLEGWAVGAGLSRGVSGKAVPNKGLLH